jgi:lactoylglutathione lyase
MNPQKMRIEHLAIWVKDLENMKAFYCHYFNMKSGDLYVNEKKGFSSYFLSFETGARLELMHQGDILESEFGRDLLIGINHLAISVGSKEKVDQLTEKLRVDGIRILGEPRTTGDGYYESVIGDPEGNLIEITI